MTYRKFLVVIALVGAAGLALSLSEAASSKSNIITYNKIPPTASSTITEVANDSLPEAENFTEIKKKPKIPTVKKTIKVVLETEKQVIETKPDTKYGVFSVPFYSQFTDITPVAWKKIGCGIASLAMLIEFYEPGSVSVDELLQEGIKSNAYLSDAGWTHSGLINLSKKYGLEGSSIDMAGDNMETAFAKLKKVLKDGPVMVSVHYTFDPKNPIPHLVVINGVSDGKVYYNDPAEKTGGGNISIAKFQSSWKKRYIQIREAA